MDTTIPKLPAGWTVKPVRSRRLSVYASNGECRGYGFRNHNEAVAFAVQQAAEARAARRRFQARRTAG